MRSRVLAVVLAAATLAAFGGAAFLIKVSEQRIASVRAGARAFDAAAQDAMSSAVEFDADRTVASLASLRPLATTNKARASVDRALRDAANLTDVAPILEQLNIAEAAEQQAAVEAESARRADEAFALAGPVVFATIALWLLAALWPTSASRQDDSSLSQLTSKPAPPAQPAAAVLRAASQVCTNLGRVSDLEELQTLIGQAADLMDASGLIVWMSVPGAVELRPALSHGYPPEMMSRLPPLTRSADNAAARAFRTSQLQIVLARPGSSNGAVVAPLLTPTGCVGVISAEIRSGGETSDAVQALAAIFAAQLANVLHITPHSHEQRATGTGGA